MCALHAPPRNRETCTLPAAVSRYGACRQGRAGVTLGNEEGDSVERSPTRAVGIIGSGAIGGPIAAALTAGEVPHCTLAGVLGRHDDRTAVAALASRADVVVEAASQEAVATHGPVIVAGGADLLVMSVGALIDASLRTRLSGGPGRVLLSTGAIGGVDILRAAAACAPFDHVSLRTTKRPAALERPWMDDRMRDRLRASAERIVVFAGNGLDAVERFPASVNVAATIGFATVGVERLAVEVVADPVSGLPLVVPARQAPPAWPRPAAANHPSSATPGGPLD